MSNLLGARLISNDRTKLLLVQSGKLFYPTYLREITPEGTLVPKHWAEGVEPVPASYVRTVPKT